MWLMTTVITNKDVVLCHGIQLYSASMMHNERNTHMANGVAVLSADCPLIAVQGIKTVNLDVVNEREPRAYIRRCKAIGHILKTSDGQTTKNLTAIAT